MTDEDKLIEARRHVAALKAFYIHLIVFACVMTGLAGINAATKSDWWVHWPLFGWGIGIVGHAIGVFAPLNLFGQDWEERKINEHIAKK